MTPPEVGEMPFGNISQTTLYVLPGCGKLYADHPYWSTFAKIVENENPTLEIKEVIIDGIRYKVYSDYAEVIGAEEGNCPEEVVFKETVNSNGSIVPVTSIAYHAFLGSQIKKVKVPKSIINWSSGVFSNCDQLTEAIIESPIRELPAMTFESCVQLINLELPETIEVLGQYAISESSIKELYLPKHLKEMQWNSIISASKLEKFLHAIRINSPCPAIFLYIKTNIRPKG